MQFPCLIQVRRADPFTGVRYWLDQHQRQPFGGPGKCRALYWKRVSVWFCDGWRSPLTLPQISRVLAIGSPQQLGGPARCASPLLNQSAEDGTDKKRGHLSFGPFLHLACHWICILPNVATTTHMPTLDGNRNGHQGLDSSHLRCGELTCRYQRRAGHVVA
jgi:hypothetical protein